MAPSESAAVDRLVIAYAFAPYVDTSAIIAAKRVRARGEPVDLIHNDLNRIRSVDHGLDSIAGDLIVHRAELTAPALFGSWPSITRFVETGQAQVEAWESSGRRYSSLYSRAHFTASHVLAAVLKADRPSLFWEAEFSDILSRKVDGQRRTAEMVPNDLLERISTILRDRGVTVPDGTRLFEWAEILTYVLADRLIFTNAAQVETTCAWAPMAELTTLIRNKAVVDHQPAPPEVLYRTGVSEIRPDPEEISIGYFGNISAGRGPLTAVEALGSLPPDLRRGIRLWIFTHAHEDITARADELGIRDQVTARPFVPYLEMLTLLRRMDVLLVSDHARPPGQPRNPYLLAKWSDYKASRTPVWALVDPGSTLSEQSLAYQSPLKHVTAAMQTLTRIVNDRRTGMA